MQDLYAIRAFHALYKHGNLTKAAKHLNQPKSTVSRRIIKLEEEIGHTLVRYEGHKQIITKAGEIFFEYSEKFISLSEECSQSLQNHDSKVSGELVIVSNLGLIRGWLTRLIDQFLNENPNVSIRLFSQFSDELLEVEPDIILSIGANESFITYKKEVIDHWYYGLYASQKYLNNYEMITHPSELDRHQWLQFSEPSQTTLCLTHKKHGSFFFNPPNSRLNSDNSILQLDGLIQGRGIGFMPIHMAAGFNRSHSTELVRCLEEWRSQPIEIISYTPKGKQSRKVQTFVEKLKSNRLNKNI